jgi:peptidoglycan DL-endopeptidase CwlO
LPSHRKPRTRSPRSTAAKRGAISVTTAALASVSLLSQSANASPSSPTDKGGGSGKPHIEEVKKKVDRLYRQAERSTQRYDAAKEKSEAQRHKVDRMLDRVAKRTAKLNSARRLLGSYATAQYRTGGISQTATLLLTEDPQSFFSQTHQLDRMTGRQKQAVQDYERRKRKADEQRAEAAGQLRSLSSSQQRLRKEKRAVQGKLSEARRLLSKLTEREKARLAAIEREKRAEARRKAEEREREREHDGGSGDGTGSTPPSSKAGEVIAFAKKQLGKPYVWGATGPNSYDCSGLTQDAWKTAGVSLPRTTWDQVEVGTKVAKSQMRPGDLVFFYDDISHVGIYAGDGKMIHAPKPGSTVTYESVDYMPFHSAVRPG